MSKPLQAVTLGTRASALARWQTDYVAKLLQAAWPELDIRIQVITTRGDQMLDTPLPLLGGKGVFTAELEHALYSGQIDLAVHSLKDLPTENPPGLCVGAVPPRASAGDILISRKNYTLATLPEGAQVGTSSRRRAAQLLYHRPDFRMLDIRGNVDTRIRKALEPDSPYDAIVLAQAGIERLGQASLISELLPLDVMLPAPGQGALAVQCRDEAASRQLLMTLNHMPTQIAVMAERTCLAGLGGGCSLPIAAYAEVQDGKLRLHGRVSTRAGRPQLDVMVSGKAELSAAEHTGMEAARVLLEQGAAQLLEVVE